MEMNDRYRLWIADSSSVGDARRIGVELARSAGFDEGDAGRVAISLTEAASNLVKHAGGGDLLLQDLRNGRGRGVGLVAIDKGPGISNLGQALRDGYSTHGSSGNGLGAIARQANAFDIFSSESGTALVARFWPGTEPEPAGALRVGGLCVATKGEDICGDDWAVVTGEGGRTALLMADGLGHGPGAAAASGAARNAFAAVAHESPAEILKRLHQALRPTRGAAVAVAVLDLGQGVVHYAGVGNIAATIVNDEGSRSLVSLHGTLGHDARKFQEFRYPWTRDSLLVLNSDGLVSHWALDPYRGLRQRDPSLVAAVLFRDFHRGTDDASVVAMRQA